MARGNRLTLLGRRGALGFLLYLLGLALAPPVHATIKYGPIELSGSVDSQSLFRSSQIDEWQWIQNRNTALIRLDYEWFQNGKLIDRLNVPFIKRSKLYLLYRGVYDSFWDIAPGGRQKGVTYYDDLVGGPISGHDIGSTRNLRPGETTCPDGASPPCAKDGLYTRTNQTARDGFEFENRLREAYIDFALTDAPLSFRIGRQQVIWGESDQFRLMDVINPIDTTWHLQQEEWDKIRIPLWLVKIIWDMGDLGPISNAFTEVVWNPGDYQPGNKVEFLPAPWAVPVSNPVRSGQIQVADPSSPDSLLSPVFNLQGTSYRKGDFLRNPGDASDIGIRFHGVTDIPLVHMDGFEFTANYLYARGRGIGAVAGSPFGLKINSINVNPNLFMLQNGGFGRLTTAAPGATWNGYFVRPAFVEAEFVHPYTHIFGATANWFEGNYTNTVFRLETAYQLGAPFQTADLNKRVDIEGYDPTLALKAPLGFTKKDVWAGMIGFDRPTWIKFLNPRTTWFITGQFFWSYVAGTAQNLRGGILTASKTPYYTPPDEGGVWNTKQGFGQWDNGPFAGQVERTQTACSGASAVSPCRPGQGLANNLNGNADTFRQWELLTTIAATSFYWGGTFVPFVAVAIDPVNRNFLAQLKFDYFITNNFIVQLRENFYNDLGSGRVSLDPWGAGGLNARRDETGIKITYQF